MNVTALVTIPLVDILEEMGIDESKFDKITDKMTDYLENEGEGVPEVCDGFASYLEDDELLKGALKAAKVDEAAFNRILKSASKDNHDLPAYILF